MVRRTAPGRELPISAIVTTRHLNLDARGSRSVRPTVPTQEPNMKRELRSTVLAVLAATFVVLGTGSEALHPPGFAMEPIENYGGGVSGHPS